jgi:hypothetical protein
MQSDGSRYQQVSEAGPDHEGAPEISDSDYDPVAIAPGTDLNPSWVSIHR